MNKTKLTAMKLIWVFLVTFFQVLNGQSYNDTQTIFTNLLNSNRYHTDVIPKLDQSEPIYVSVSFDLISIVSVDDITQAFTCNGVFTFKWKDERLTWDPSQYGGQVLIHPVPKLIWRPRVVLINTLGDRDLFEDDFSPNVVDFNGDAQWIPGSLFVISCSLSLLKYPFDEQQCSIIMLSMGLTASELVFLPGELETTFFSENGEWELKDANITTSAPGPGDLQIPRIEVTFKIKRRPTLYLLNTIFPVVFLSLLNMVVFCIPVESGEKISYGITVVLAISVFLSQISALLPRSSTEVPYVTIYLFSLYMVSVLSVLDAILIVFLYHLEEKTLFKRKIFNRFDRAINKISKMRQTIAPLKEKDDKWSTSLSTQSKGKSPLTETKSILDQLGLGQRSEVNSLEVTDDKETGKGKDFLARPPGHEKGSDDASVPNRYKIIGDHIDFISFIVFISIWIILTLWFFICVNV